VVCAFCEVPIATDECSDLKLAKNAVSACRFFRLRYVRALYARTLRRSGAAALVPAAKETMPAAARPTPDTET